MTQNILVRLEIPIPVTRVVATPAIVFSRWMPSTEDEFIVVQENDAIVTIWCDKSCLAHVKDVQDISQHVNVLVDKIFADVTLLNLDDELVEYIRTTASKSRPDPGAFQSEYEELGRRVHCLTLIHVNRLISFLRTQKGQYWLQEYPVDEGSVYQANLAFKAEVSIDSEWFRWFPTNQTVLRPRDGGSRDEDRFVTQSDWVKAQEFVASSQRSPLKWELLAGAEWLAGIGHRRSALTEAVTALEAAVFGFAEAAGDERVFGHLITRRTNVKTLKQWVKRRHLSGMVYYLFPVLFSEEELPTSVLQGCQQAVEERNLVVHSSTPQRDVQEEKLSWYLDSIREMCNILERHQAS